MKFTTQNLAFAAFVCCRCYVVISMLMCGCLSSSTSYQFAAAMQMGYLDQHLCGGVSKVVLSFSLEHLTEWHSGSATVECTGLLVMWMCSVQGAGWRFWSRIWRQNASYGSSTIVIPFRWTAAVLRRSLQGASLSLRATRSCGFQLLRVIQVIFYFKPS